MKKLLFSLFAITLATAMVAQNPVFEEEISIPAGWTLDSILLPPSPLTTQVLFVGGHDLVQTTETYSNPAGRQVAKEWHDFIGFTPDDTGESLGWVSVNHETIYVDDKIGDGGGMTVFRVARNNEGTLDIVEQTLEDGRQGEYFNVDFVNTVGETGMNCAGISAPDGRIWTAEEWFRGSNSSIWNSSARTSSLPLVVAGVRGAYGVRDTSDFTINAPEFPLVDGLTISKNDNFNYMVEIDPRQAKAIRKQYNWGRAGWEGGAITSDMKTVYLGDDSSPAPFIKFEADVAGDFTQGTLYFYKHDNDAGQRWVAIPMDTEEIIFGGLRDYCFANGATIFMRNEWVAIDQSTGIVYWTETGRDNAGSRFKSVQDEFPSVNVHPALDQFATETQGLTSAFDENYADYYGRVWSYDPATNEVDVMIHGGPYFETSPAEADYPDKHLSNPDGLNVMTIDGETFLLINEDLNGTSNGRVPEGVSNRVCELWLLPTSTRGSATIDDLVRITAIPQGAEVTGSIQISDNTILMNSQHPNPNNPFPWNHSLTVAIHGFENVSVSNLNPPVFEEGEKLKLFPNPTTRELFLSEITDFAIYNLNGQRVKVYRNTQQADVSDLAPGTYFILTEDQESYKFIVQ